MKPSSIFALAGLMVAAVSAGATARAVEPVDLITNGGFEEGLDGWNPDAQHSLVTDRAVAHSGESCLTGEVTEPKRALILRRKVPVKASNRYEFSIWAKAANRTKLVLRIVHPGMVEKQTDGDTRPLAGSWDKLSRQWQKCSCQIAPRSDGMLELMIVAPSSHGSPTGQIWIDDISLIEIEMPSLTTVSEGGFSDEAAMTAAADDSVYVAYNAFRDQADSLQIARLKPQEKNLNRLGQWRVVGGAGTYISGIRVTSSSEGVTVVYAAEDDGNWDIYAVSCGPHGPARPVRITTGPQVDVKPDAAWSGGTLFVTWESNPGGIRQVFAASVHDGKVSEPVALSPPDVSAYGPSLSVTESGRASVAYHSFRENNYDVYLRRTAGGGSWAPEIRLTHAPAIDRHANLLARGDELWLIYETAQMGSANRDYGIGSTTGRKLLLAKVTQEGLAAPKGYLENSPLARQCEAPSAAFDSGGRLWVTFRRPDAGTRAWNVFITCFDGRQWRRPSPISHLKGMDRPSPIAILADRALVAYQADDNPKSFAEIELASQATSDVFLAGLDLDVSTPVALSEFEPLVESDEPFTPGSVRVARGEDTPTPSITYGGQKLKLFFGDLHDHTDVSICNRLGDESINESYQNMRDIVRHDFACVTDHGYNHTPYSWNYTAKQARINDDPGRFLTFLAEEWTSTFEEYSEKHPYGFYGHRNLIFADPYFPRWWSARNRQTPAELWEDLRELNANFVNIPHQLADTGNVPTDWDFADEEAQPVAEIFQARGSYEYKGAPREAARSTPGPGAFIQDAWARGIVIGVIASPDHGGGYGKACVFAPELSREAILDAIRARRCYGTTAAKIFLDVRVDGHLMGEKVTELAGQSVEVKIVVRCPADIGRIEVCRNNQFIYSQSPPGREAEITFLDRDPIKERSYYYVRVIQKDEEIAWSSPVWFGAE